MIIREHPVRDPDANVDKRDCVLENMPENAKMCLPRSLEPPLLARTGHTGEARFFFHRRGHAQRQRH